jgi:hypothetical protein
VSWQGEPGGGGTTAEQNMLTMPYKKLDEVILLDLRFSLWWLYIGMQSVDFQWTTWRYISRDKRSCK